MKMQQWWSGVAGALLLAAAHQAAPAEAVLNVWMDVDPAVMRGGNEPDDGLALLQAFNSEELRVRGVSVVHGNVSLAVGLPIAQEVVARFGPADLQVHAGAASAAELGTPTAASRALTDALRKTPLTILALGPMTTVATVLLQHPELALRIERVVAVAGRRPGQQFVLGRGYRPLMDLNFDLDPQAFAVLLDTDVPVVLAPFEISARVALDEADLRRVTAPAFLDYFAAPIGDYIDWYEEHMGVRAIYPFDTLAVGYLTSPQWFDCEELPVTMQVLADDTRKQGDKPYLLLAAELPATRTATYCHTAAAPFKADLLRRLDGVPVDSL